MLVILEKGASLKFKHISENTRKLVDALLDNQEFLKWITYLDDNPSSMPKVNPKYVLGDRIILTRFNEDILKERVIKIFLSPFKGISHRDQILADDVYTMDIAMPNDFSYIYKYMIDRFAEIARQVAISLDQQRVTGIGEVKVDSSYKTYKINETYVGMTLFITVTNGSAKVVM